VRTFREEESGREVDMIQMSRGVAMGSLLLVGGLVLGTSISVTAQSPPPVQGTIALEGTVNKVYAAANTIIVGTLDGVEHVFHYTKDTLLHGAPGTDINALQGIREGSAVVVHYTVEGSNESAHEIDRIGDGGLKVIEGVVTRVDRARKQITIKHSNGTTETLRLTDHAAVDAGKDLDQAATGGTRVVVYYTDATGQKLAHFFKKIS